jgi:prepilin-type N-terminal cleavage/methylation domain-containing protein
VLNRKKSQQIPGFTWIELLVVMVVVGILAAIALPSLRACACQERGGEAKQYVGTLARTQQVFLLEQKHFASSMAELGKPNSSDTRNYSYSTVNHKTKAFVFGKSQKPSLESYVAGIFMNPVEKNTSTAIVCKAKERGTHPIELPIDANTCGEGTVNVAQKK